MFYEQLGHSLPKGTIVSIGEGEPLLEKLIQGASLDGERCFVVGESPRPGLIHEQPESRPKTACDYDYIASIWPQLDWYLEGGDFYVGVQTKRGCPTTAATASTPSWKASRCASTRWMRW